MRRIIITIIVLTLIFTFVSCSEKNDNTIDQSIDTIDQSIDDFIMTEQISDLLSKGYSVVEDTIVIEENNASNDISEDLSGLICRFPLDEFERMLWLASAECYVVKATKVSTQHFYKDLGYYSYKSGGLTLSLRDLRKLKLTSVRIDEIYDSSVPGKEKIKVGDIVIVHEGYNNRGIADGESICYIAKWDEEPYRLGNEVNGYDEFNDLWGSASFSIDTKLAHDKNVDYLCEDVFNKYLTK